MGTDTNIRVGYNEQEFKKVSLVLSMMMDLSCTGKQVEGSRGEKETCGVQDVHTKRWKGGSRHRIGQLSSCQRGSSICGSCGLSDAA